MLGFDFKYRGQSLSDNDFDTVNGLGIVLQSVDWAEVITDDDQVPIQGYHGIDASPTLYRARVINIEGVISASTRSEVATYKDILTDIFKLESVPSPDNRGFYDFEFTDDDSVNKVISAKVLNAPRYTQVLGERDVTNFIVQLVAENPVIKAKTASSQVALEGFFGGFKLPVKLPASMDDYGYTTDLTNSGNWNAPLKVTITANGTTGANLRVLNTLTGQYFGVQTPLVDGDVLVLDSETATMTLNGNDISGDRIAGSIWHFLLDGSNTFTVLDDSTQLGDGLVADVLFEWNNTWI